MQAQRIERIRAGAQLVGHEKRSLALIRQASKSRGDMVK